jgi:hypothetical protein
MRNFIFLRFLLLLLPFVMSGCTAVQSVKTSVKSTMQDIQDSNIQNFTVVTPSIENAHCRITDNRGRGWDILATPGSVMLQQGYGPLTVICNKDGYKPGVAIVKDNSNVVLHASKYVGVPPTYPAQVSITLEPRIFSSNAEKEDWEMKQLVEEKDKEEAKHQCYFSPFHNC